MQKSNAALAFQNTHHRGHHTVVLPVCVSNIVQSVLIIVVVVASHDDLSHSTAVGNFDIGYDGGQASHSFITCSMVVGGRSFGGGRAFQYVQCQCG